MKNNKRKGFLLAIAVVLTISLGAPTLAMASWLINHSNTGNTLTIAPLIPYEWSLAAQGYEQNGIVYDKLDGVGTPLNLRSMFGESTLTASYTPVGGTEAAVSDPTAFVPSVEGELTVAPNKPWYTNPTITVSVTIDELLKHKVSFAVSYPAWYVETDDVVTVVATNEQNEVTTLTATTDGVEGDYAVNLPDGTYDLEFMSARFRKDALVDSIVVDDIEIDGDDYDAGAITFGTPKLAVETGTNFAYDDTGFKIPSGNTAFRPLAGNVKATEGFTVSYTMASTGTGWHSGAFCFKIDNKWYTMGIYPASNSASAAARIHIAEQIETEPNKVVFKNLFYLTTDKTVSGTNSFNIEIAYYGDDFFIRLNGDYALRLSGGLFAADRHCKVTADNCPIWFSDTEYKKFTGETSGFDTVTPSKFFGAGERIFGFKGIDNTSTFTNVQYKLNNTAAQTLIKDMRTTANGMTRQICDITNPWPAWTAE